MEFERLLGDMSSLKDLDYITLKVIRWDMEQFYYRTSRNTADIGKRTVQDMLKDTRSGLVNIVKHGDVLASSKGDRDG